MLYVADSQVGFAPKIIHLIPNFWVDSYRGYVGTIFRFIAFSQQCFEFVVGKGNAPPFGRYASQALVYFGANQFIVSEVSFERFEKPVSLFGSAVLAVTSTSLELDSSRSSVMSSSEGEILN